MLWMSSIFDFWKFASEFVFLGVRVPFFFSILFTKRTHIWAKFNNNRLNSIRSVYCLQFRYYNILIRNVQCSVTCRLFVVFFSPRLPHLFSGSNTISITRKPIVAYCLFELRSSSFCVLRDRIIIIKKKSSKRNENFQKLISIQTVGIFSSYLLYWDRGSKTMSKCSI